MWHDFSPCLFPPIMPSIERRTGKPIVNQQATNHGVHGAHGAKEPRPGITIFPTDQSIKPNDLSSFAVRAMYAVVQKRFSDYHRARQTTTATDETT
jgi:hypothetical protein